VGQKLEGRERLMTIREILENFREMVKNLDDSLEEGLSKVESGNFLDLEILQLFLVAGYGIGLPPQSWSTVIVRKRRIRGGEQTTQTGRDRHEVTAG